MENNAQGQIVLDAYKSAPFEHRREEAYSFPTNNGAADRRKALSLRGEETSLPVPDRREALSLRGPLREINWIKPDIKHNPVIAVFCFIGCATGIGLMATAALLTYSPFVFPSLGPTAFLFFSNPTAPAASPRNTIIGHTIGVLAGYFSLVVTGLTTAGPALQVGVTIPRIIAIALSLSLTAGLMVLFRASHPPAGATTLIVSLGILAKPWQLEVLMGAVVLLTLFAVLFNRLVGIPYPLWRTVPHKVSSGTTVESDLWVCCTDTDKGEGCSDTNVCSNGEFSKTVESNLWVCCTGTGNGEGCSDTNLCSNREFSKREDLSRVKSTHVRLVPLDAGW